MDAIDRYRDLRLRIDQLAGELARSHGGHLVCGPGCSQCCVNLSVFPVEYAAILDELKQAGNMPVLDAEASCGFLKDNLCQIYPYRPIICRTHGLPVAFVNTDLPDAPINVSFCPMNFADADLDQYEFGPANTLDLDAINAELAEINAEFLIGKAQGQSQRVALIQLAEDLK